MDTNQTPHQGMTDDEKSPYVQLIDEGKRLMNLEIENVRLLVTEKLTLLLGRVTLVAVTFVIATCALIFLTMSAADFLLQELPPRWTYMIVGGFYVLLVVIAAVCRRQLIVDPIARYLSRVILDPRPCGSKPSGGASSAASGSIISHPDK